MWNIIKVSRLLTAYFNGKVYGLKLETIPNKIKNVNGFKWVKYRLKLETIPNKNKNVNGFMERIALTFQNGPKNICFHLGLFNWWKN